MYSILYPLDPSGPSDVSCCEMEGACQLSFQAFSSKFWVCDVSLTGRVSRIWGTMGLWATLDCVWDVVDPFIYGTETITKSFFAVKWNQVFKKKVSAATTVWVAVSIFQNFSTVLPLLVDLYCHYISSPLFNQSANCLHTASSASSYPVTCLEKCMQACLLRLHTQETSVCVNRAQTRCHRFCFRRFEWQVIGALSPITCHSNLLFVTGSQSQWSWLKRERSLNCFFLSRQSHPLSGEFSFEGFRIWPIYQ